MNCIAARTSTTPRSNRPRLKSIRPVPNLPGIGCNIDRLRELREFAKSTYEHMKPAGVSGSSSINCNTEHICSSTSSQVSGSSKIYCNTEYLCSSTSSQVSGSGPLQCKAATIEREQKRIDTDPLEPLFVESEYLRKYVEANPRGALTKGSDPPMQVAPSRFLEHPLLSLQGTLELRTQLNVSMAPLPK